jgi:hypothetical protein
MRKFIRISVIFIACISAWAQTNLPTLQDILRRHEAALGGREKI